MTVLCVGYANLDHIALTRATAQRDHTRTIIRPWPSPTPGGCACNIAVGLARLGHHSAVQLSLGSDAASQQFLEGLQREGVDITRVERQRGARLPQIYFFVTDALSEAFFDPGGLTDRPHQLSLDGVSHLVITVGPPRATLDYFAQARQAGVRVIWQLKQDYTAIPNATLLSCLRQTDFLFCNEAEYANLRRLLGQEAVQALLHSSLLAVVVTRGDAGSEVITADEKTAVPIAPAQFLEGTGAGDAYTSGFLHGLLDGRSLPDCARLGAVTASLVVGQWGCQAGLPTRRELALIERSKL